MDKDEGFTSGLPHSISEALVNIYNSRNNSKIQALEFQDAINSDVVSFTKVARYLSFNTARAAEVGKLIEDTYIEMGGICANPLSRNIVRRIISNPNARLTFILVLIWIVSAAIPVASLAGSPETQTALSGEYGTLAIALAITWRILDKRKR